MSDADREQVIGALKTAFVLGALAKDEFDLRVGQAFASRTYAELAAVTAGLPAEPAAAQLTRPAWTLDDMMQRPGRMMAVATAFFAGIWAFTFVLPWPRNSEGDPPKPLALLFFPSAVLYLVALVLVLIGVVNVIALRVGKRSGGRPPRPSASPGARFPAGGRGHQRPYGPGPADVPG